MLESIVDKRKKLTKQEEEDLKTGEDNSSVIECFLKKAREMRRKAKHDKTKEYYEAGGAK